MLSGSFQEEFHVSCSIGQRYNHLTIGEKFIDKIDKPRFSSENKNIAWKVGMREK
jgi:hypothetical protein